MALTNEMKVVLSDLPSGYTAPTTTITFGANKREERFSADIGASGISHASTASTGLTDLVAALKTWIENTFVPGANGLGLDVSTRTIKSIATVKKITRDNNQSSDTDKLYLTGTDTYHVEGTITWEVTA